jgi:hypothetical protein
MTVKQIIETIQLYYPAVNETEAVITLNSMLRQFCSKTKLLQGTQDVTVASLSGATQLAFPSTFEKVDEVFLLDASNKLVNVDYTIRDKTIYFVDSTGEQLTALPAEGVTLRLHGIKRPTALASLGASPDIDEQFHPVLYAMYLEQKLAAGGNDKTAAYWRVVVRDFERDAKIIATRNGDGSDYAPILARY